MSDAASGVGQAASGVAEAVTRLTEQTQGLVQEQIAGARSEVVDKLKANLPAAAALGAAGVLGVFTLASAYRWGAALLEERMPPATAAFVGMLLDASLAGGAAVLGTRLLKAAPTPLPTETAKSASDAVVDVREAVQEGVEQGRASS